MQPSIFSVFPRARKGGGQERIPDVHDFCWELQDIQSGDLSSEPFGRINI